MSNQRIGSGGSNMKRLVEIINLFDTIQLNEMDSVKLLNRLDTKFLLSPSVLKNCLTSIVDDYKVLEIDQKRMLSYSTTYFDTDDFSMFRDHHNGKKRRYKVRYRQYEESGDMFLEVKRKEKGRTHKSRLAIDNLNVDLEGGLQSFVEDASPYQVSNLIPKLNTKFNRITFVNKNACERITIDLGIEFEKEGHFFTLPNCSIVEIKRDRDELYSDFARTMKEHGVLPMSMSKYCVGTIALNEGAKYNRFKPRLRKLNNLMSEVNSHYAFGI